MLRLRIGATELFDNETQTFSTEDDGIVVDLEHSLASVSKWESKHQKPFIASGEKSTDEIFDYLKSMIVTPDVDPDVLLKCSQEQLEEIQKYIDSSQSATTFGTMPGHRGPGETITSELIYFWMVSFNIPFECQYWHLNRLFSLIRIHNIKTSKPKKLPRHEIAMRNRELNEKRRRELGTTG